MRALSLAVLLMLSAWVATDDASFAAQTDDKDAIAEAVFRYQVGTCYGGMSRNVYFLRRDREDPSDEFMARFKGEKPSVKKYSQMVANSMEEGLKDEGFRDKESGERGIVLIVEKIKQVSETEAEAQGGCVAGALNGYGYEYRVVREKDKWIVKESRPTWVS